MKKGRPKKQKVNNQPIAQEQLIERIKIDYLNSSGQITLADLCKKYCLSNLKLRKILITAGVYDTPQYRAIKALKDKGLSDEEIILGLTSIVNLQQGKIKFSKGIDKTEKIEYNINEVVIPSM